MDLTEASGAPNAKTETKPMLTTGRRKLTKLRNGGGRKIKNDLYIVEDVIDEKVVKGQTLYRIRWQGYSEKEDSWEPEGNLKNVRHILNKFKNSKKIQIDLTKSMKRSSSTCSLTENTDSNDCSNDSLKNRKAKQRRFEYVPQSEFVASKTKYFDDIRDGKIDLVSNDLYSRVKTRRRCLGGTESSTSSIQDDKNDSETENGMTMASYSSALSSPPIHSDFDKNFFDTNSNNEDIKQPISEKSADQYELIEIYESQSNVSKMSSTHSLAHEESSEKKQVETKKEELSPPSAQSSEETPKPELPKFSDSPGSSKQNHEEEEPNTETVPESVVILEGEKNDCLPSEDVEESEVTLNTSESVPSSENKNNPASNELPEETNTTEVETEKKDCCPENVTHSLDQLLSEYSSLVSKGQVYSFLQTLPRYKPQFLKISTWDHLDRFTHFHQSQLDYISSETLDQLSCEKGKDSGSLIIHALSAADGRPSFLRQCLDLEGVNLNSIVDPKTSLPVLHLAVCLNRQLAVKMLLDAGARINETEAASGSFRTPLAMAIYAGNYDLVMVLLLNGANFYQVETETTALKLIQKLLEYHTVSTSCSRPQVTNTPTEIHLSTQELGVTKIPNFILIHALYKKPLTASGHLLESPSPIPLQTSSTASNQIDYDFLPPVNTLRMMYDFISIHHAKLTTKANQLVDTWLYHHNLRRHCTLSQSNWFSLRDTRASLNIQWPLPDHLQSEEKEFPLLLLIHGLVIGPGVFHLWLDSSGPCYTKTVVMGGVIQRPLGVELYASTLLPVPCDEARKYDIHVNFCEAKEIPASHCIAPLALAVTFAKPAKPEPPVPPTIR